MSSTATVISNIRNVVNIEPGSLYGSIFGLIAACMGAGTLTMPYIISKTGIVLGPLLVSAGAWLSYYSARLVIKCNTLTGRLTYEDFAEAAFGKRTARLVSIVILISLLGFATAYVSLAKTLIPKALETGFGKASLPVWLQNNELGRLVAVTLFTLFIFLPLSMFQDLSALRFSSMLGVMCTLVLLLVIVNQFCSNKALVPNMSANFENSTKANGDFDSIVEAVPYITFLYMFQPNVP